MVIVPQNSTYGIHDRLHRRVAIQAVVAVLRHVPQAVASWIVNRNCANQLTQYTLYSGALASAQLLWVVAFPGLLLFSKFRGARSMDLRVSDEFSREISEDSAVAWLQRRIFPRQRRSRVASISRERE
mmetsp:Transcript_1728/g.3270  ORF Transcript_1728/g.3270 Transcript_1728/m.3270 type:complete len:128 (+) Transcript_1728:1-384(+)